MNPRIRAIRTALVAVALVGSMIAASSPAAIAGPGQQRAFLAHLTNTERAVAAAEAKVEHLSPAIVGKAHALRAQAASLASAAASLSDDDLIALSATDVNARLAALSVTITDLVSDPRLAQVLNADQLAAVTADLTSAQTALQGSTDEINRLLVLWNTLGSMAEVGSSAVGTPGTLTIAGAEFVAGRFGGGVLIPASRADQSQQLRFDYTLTPEGTIELWFKQEGYTTNGGQPDDGRFHSFWSPDIRPYETRGASLLTYQVPWEAWHFDVWDGTDSIRNSIEPTIAAGEWHHLAFTWSSAGDYSEVYLDGALVNRREGTLGITPTYLPLQFGFDWDSNTRGVTSVLDNLKIWSVARTDFSDRFTE
jgi:hypothetical protein